ncbi:MAG: hypothetical protein ACREGG_01965 [Candidatus Saccharimonadales bacterium]
MTKLIEPESDKNLLKRSGIAIIDSTVGKVPGLSLPWELSKAYYGNALELRQKRALEWVEMVRNNPTVFSKEILQTEEFQDGFVAGLEHYMKLRVKDKRIVAQQIFTNFCGSPDKPNFPLERYDDTLVKISVEGLQYLAFLEKEIIPLRDIEIEKKYQQGNYPPPPQGKGKEWWIEHYRITEPISDYASKWLKEVYEPSIDVSEVNQAKEEYRQEKVQEKRDSLSNLSLEMEQLGIMRSYSNGVVYGGGGNVSTLTPYGRKFIKFIPKTA